MGLAIGAIKQTTREREKETWGDKREHKRGTTSECEADFRLIFCHVPVAVEGVLMVME